MAQFRKFSGLRTYDAPLQRDLRELERYLTALDQRVGALAGEGAAAVAQASGPGGLNPGNVGLTKHAKTHATQVDASTGSDSLDAYFMRWRKHQEIKPTLASKTKVPLTIYRSSSGQTGDMLNIFDIVNAEALAVSKTGLTSLGNANETARLNIKNSATPLPIAPDAFPNHDPLVWIFANDETPVGSPSSINEMKQKGSFARQFYGDGRATGNNRIDWFENAINSLAVYQQPATASDRMANGILQYLESSGNGTWIDDITLSGTFTAMVVYRSDNHLGAKVSGKYWAMGLGQGVTTSGTYVSGFAVPNSDNSTFHDQAYLLHTADAAGTYIFRNTTTSPTADLATRIAIIGRDVSNNVRCYGTIDAGTGTASLFSYAGYDSNNDGTIDVATPTTMPGDVSVNAFMQINGTNEAPAGCRIAEVIVYSTYLSDAEILQLYQWAAQRYALTELVADDVPGQTGELLHIWGGSDITVLQVDAAGYTGIGQGVDPSVRLHVGDAAATQLRLDSLDALNSWDFYAATSTNDGNMSITPNADSWLGVNTAVTDLSAMLDVTYAGSPQLALKFDNSNRALFQVNAAGHLNIVPTGMVGINKITPTAELNVLSVAASNPQLRLEESGGNAWDISTEGTGHLGLMPTLSTANVGIGTLTPVARLQVIDTDYPQFHVGPDAGNRFSIEVGAAGQTNIIPHQTGGAEQTLGVHRGVTQNRFGILHVSNQPTSLVSPQLCLQNGADPADDADYITFEMKDSGECEFDIVTDGTPLLLFSEPVTITGLLTLNAPLTITTTTLPQFTICNVAPNQWDFSVGTAGQDGSMSMVPGQSDAGLGINTPLGSILGQVHVTTNSIAQLILAYDASNSIVFRVNATGSLGITPTQRIGINKASPIGMLHVLSTDALSPQLRLEEASGDAWDISTQPSGALGIVPTLSTAQVGINTDVPAARLHVFGSEQPQYRQGPSAGNRFSMETGPDGTTNLVAHGDGGIGRTVGFHRSATVAHYGNIHSSTAPDYPITPQLCLQSFDSAGDTADYVTFEVVDGGDLTIEASDGDAIDFNLSKTSAANCEFRFNNVSGSSCDLIIDTGADAAVRFNQAGTPVWRLYNDSSVVGGTPDTFTLSAGLVSPDIMAWLPSGSVGINHQNPLAALDVLKTTEQLRLSYDLTNYASFTTASDGVLTVNSVSAISDARIILNDPVTVVGDSTGTWQPTLHVDGSSTGEVTQFQVTSNGGGQSANYSSWINGANSRTLLCVNGNGQLAGPDPSADDGFNGQTFQIVSYANAPGVPTTKFPAFTFVADNANAGTPREPGGHTEWVRDATYGGVYPANVLLNLLSDGTLWKGWYGTGTRYWASGDNATWTGTHVFNQPITLPGSGAAIISTVADDASAYAFDFQDTVARTTGNEFRIRNSADNKEMIKLSFDGRLSIGYAASISPLGGALMSFNYLDSQSTVQTNMGMVGTLRHDSATITPSRLGGIGGVVSVEAGATTPSGNFVYGVIGTAVANKDATGFSSKVIAGVVGTLGADATVTETLPTQPDQGVFAGVPDQSLGGDWSHAACIWANALISYQYGSPSNPTNMPAIVSGVKSTIPEITDGEVWAYFANLGDDLVNPPTYSSYYTPITAAVAGAYRVPWPRHGTRRTHFYMIPGDTADTSSNVVGDVMFDDGDGTTVVGLHEHDGTAWRKLTPMIDHTATVTGTTATIGGIGSGPAGAAQVGWVKIKIDDGASGGRTGWMPYWQ